MNANVSDKLKNEFNKARETPDPSSMMYKERGGCLTVFLVWLIAAAAYYVFTTISSLMNASAATLAFASSLMPIILVAVIVNIAIVVFAVAMWRWKKWGYYGLVALNIAQAIIMLILGNIFGVVAAALNLAILNSVYSGRIQMFE